jgi:hypothetical protein
MTEQFPLGPQTETSTLHRHYLAGDTWSRDLLNDKDIANATIPHRTTAKQVSTFVVAGVNAGDVFGPKIDGATFEVTSTGTTDTTGPLIVTKLSTVAMLALIIASASYDDATNKVTVNFADNEAHTIENFTAPGDTDAISTILNTTTAVAQEKLTFGLFVAQDTASGAERGDIKKPTSMSDQLLGLLYHNAGFEQTPDAVRSAHIGGYSANYDSRYLKPGQGYGVNRIGSKCAQVVAGQGPAATDPVYVVMTGADAGKVRKNDGAVNATQTLLIVSTGADTLGFSYAGGTPLTLTANGTEAVDVAALVLLWNANAFYAALGTAVQDGARILVTRAGAVAFPAFTDESGGTSSVVVDSETAATAATARLETGIRSFGLVGTGELQAAKLRYSLN